MEAPGPPEEVQQLIKAIEKNEWPKAKEFMTKMEQNSLRTDTVQQLIKAIEKSEWVNARNLVSQIDANRLGMPINRRGETLLHLATETGNVKLVRCLVERMSVEDLKKKDNSGDQALIYAATIGIKEIAEIMLEQNPNLACITNNDGLIPIVIAVRNGNGEIANYLMTKTPMSDLNKNGACLLVAAIMSDMYDIALLLLKNFPKLAFDYDDPKDNPGRNALAVLAEKPTAFRSDCEFSVLQELIYKAIPLPPEENIISLQISVVQTSAITSAPARHWNNFLTIPIIAGFIEGINKFIEGINKASSWKLVPGFQMREMHDLKLKHSKVSQILKIIADELSTYNAIDLNKVGAYKSIFKASKCGIVEIVNALIECCPEWKTSFDKSNRNIFQKALLHRQEHVFNLIYKLKYKNMVTLHRDKDRNNFLHTAGSQPPPSLFNKISGSALVMQHELQWFKEVERLVPPAFKGEKNIEKKTPRELFTENHKDILKKGEKWMKETSQACMVVAALIATVVFTAAFTVTGGNNEKTGTPVYMKYGLFKLFILYDSLSLFSSLTSMLMFLAILISRFSEDDFLLTLPRKMIIGLTSLFLSIVFMIAAFSITLFIIFYDSARWVPILSLSFSCFFPVALYIILQFRLLLDMIRATYFPSIFNKKNRIVGF